MIIKAQAGDGRWDLYEGERVSFLGQGNAIAVPNGDHAYSEDDRFPDGWGYFHHYSPDPPLTDAETGAPLRLERWVKWFTPGKDECHLLVTNGAVFLCNDRGDTVEALR